ncbi:MAG: hypothetical protein AAF235_03195 [Planctomycetota bacterium]
MATPPNSLSHDDPNRVTPALGGPARAQPPVRYPVAPLWAVLGFTFAGSLGTGVVANGIYFLTRSAYAFDRERNFLLGLVFGVVYIAGAATVGPGIRRAARFVPGLSQRGLLAGLTVCLGGVCLLPRGVALAEGSALPPEWTIWVCITTQAALTGALWPIVESFLSGGRRGQHLRRATGRFNVVWSVALVVAFWGMTPLLAIGRPIEVISALGAVHLLSLLFIARLPREPAAHPHHDIEPHPPVYRDLLVVFRWLLPTSYIVMSTLSTMLPSLLDRAGVEARWAAPLAATWMTARVLTFIVFERWHGWHGRWWVAVLGLTGVLVGFAACVLAPAWFRGSAAGPTLAVILGGLALFGLAQGLIYLGALYYAMEVGSAEVDAGGTHESLIGVGYTVGPACGLLVGYLFQGSSARSDSVLVGVLSAIVVLLAVMSLFQMSRKSKQRAKRSR